MDKETLSRAAVRKVLMDYWIECKKRPWLSVGSFLLPAIGTTLVFFVPPLIVARLVNIFAASGKISLDNIGYLIGLFAGLWFLGEILWRISMHFFIKLKTVSMNSLSKIAFRRLTERDYTFYTDQFTGSLMKKSLAFSANFDVFTNIINFNVLNNVFPALFAIVILWRYSFWIPAILILSIVIAIFVALPIIKRRLRYVVARHHASSKASGRLSDSITNMITVKSFAREDQEETIYGGYINDYTHAYKKAADYQNLRLDTVMSPIYVLTNMIGLIAAIFFAGKFDLAPGVIVIVFSYYSQVTRIFWEINNTYRGIESSIAEAAEFTELFIDPPLINDIQNAKTLTVGSRAIKFNNVTFNYSENGDATFLNNFNLEIKDNQKVGLVGPSGSGKTTITKLLLRFIDIKEGSITIGEQSIKDISQQSLRESIGYVPQEPLLFHRTLLENIGYGKENATQEEIVHAAKLAYADEFIDTLPFGYETMVGERGIKLSGGQRQRVAIARAILKHAPILVLDEATSALDSESEKYIQEGLWELMKDKTALVIAHRLSTIRHLDRIIVLDQGKIVQDGTHDELIKEPGLYAKLWSHQSGEFLEDY